MGHKNTRQGALRSVLAAARGPFLLLTPVCVALGAATVAAAGRPVDGAVLCAVLAGALLAHVSVNLLNEYVDFRSGLDLHTQRTPFSGGSGALPARPDSARAVLVAGAGSLFAVIVIGCWLILLRGPGLLPLGVAGVLLVATYTPIINRLSLLCLLAPGAGFGGLMVIGTWYVLTGSYAGAPWLAAAVPFFLVNNLLLLNQYPDLAADAAAGRRHFPLAYGLKAATFVYGLFAACAVMVIMTGVVTAALPTQSLWALLPMPLALYALAGAARHGGALGYYPRYLAANVAAALLVPLVLALALFSATP